MISIISPSYNQAAYLPFCLASVAYQRKAADIEHLVMDGCSTDSSVELLRSASPQPDHWRSGRDGGQSAAINAGMARAKGGILCWINSDDGLAPDACARMEAVLGNIHGPAWAVGGCRIIGEDDSQTDVWHPIPGIHDELAAILNWRKNYLMQPAVFWNRAMWEAAGSLSEDMHYGMDFDLWLRFFSLAKPVLVADDIGIHRQQGLSKTSLVGTEIFVEYRRALNQRLSGDKKLVSLGMRDIAARAARAGNAAIFLGNSQLSRRYLREALRASNTALLEPDFIKAVVKNLLASCASH